MMLFAHYFITENRLVRHLGRWENRCQAMVTNKSK